MDELNVIRIPEEYARKELSRRYREIPLPSRTSATLRKYFNAMANLYGIIDLKTAYEIICSQCVGLFTKQQFIYFSEIARHECEDYKILSRHDLDYRCTSTPPMEWEIIDVTILDSGIDTYKELSLAHHNKPFYIPNKTRFLKYADAFFCECTPETETMKQILNSICHLEGQAADDFFDELVFSARCLNAPLSQVLTRLYDIGVTFVTEDEAQIFMTVYQAFQNNTRMQCHRGHTPNEIVAMGKPIHQLPYAHKKTAKIGRNEPCPCGSGKKYKYCCGR